MALPLLVISVMGFALLPYLMPKALLFIPAQIDPGDKFPNWVPRVELFADAFFGGPLAPMGKQAFASALTTLHVVSWVSFFLLVAALGYGGRIKSRGLIVTAGAVAAVMAIFVPPTISGDVFHYVGYARGWVYHGLNPYLHTPERLWELKDPVAPFVHHNVVSVYGPVWNQLSAFLVLILKSSSVLTQAIAMKLLAAAALFSGALIARSIAERIKPGTGNLAFAAMALNPLFLIDSAGNAHNDFIMMAFFLGAILMELRGKPIWSGLLIGLAIGIKILPIIFLPWLIVVRLTGRKSADSVKAVLLALVIAALPVVVGYIGLWEGPEMKKAFSTYFTLTQGKQQVSEHGLVSYDGEKQAKTFKEYVHDAAFPLAYLILTSFVWRSENRLNKALTAWIAVAMLFILWQPRLYGTWYMAWPLFRIRPRRRGLLEPDHVAGTLHHGRAEDAEAMARAVRPGHGSRLLRSAAEHQGAGETRAREAVALRIKECPIVGNWGTWSTRKS